MKALRCDFCGGQLVMDNSREFATCEFCGTKYLRETVREKIQEIRGEVKISGAVEVYAGTAEKERLLNNAETYIGIKEFGKAIDTYEQVTAQFPDDYRGWWGIFSTQIEKYLQTGVFENQNPGALKNAVKLCSEKDFFKRYFDTFLKSFGQELKTKETNSYYSFRKVKHSVYSIDSMSEWLLYESVYFLDLFSENFKSFLRKITDQYVDGIKNGEILPYSKYTTPPLSSENISANISDLPQYRLALNLSLRLGVSLNYVKENPPQYPETFLTLYKGSKSVKAAQIVAVTGRWIVLNDSKGNRINILSPQEILQEQIYKGLGRCQYCGGSLSGVFRPVCVSCNKPKNY